MIGMVKEVTGSYIVEYSPSEEPETIPWQVDFTPPFRRVSMIAELENKLDTTFPPATEFNTPGTVNMAVRIEPCILIYSSIQQVP